MWTDALHLVDLARRCIDEGSSGIILTQGTDTIEEFSFLLDLLWDRPEPFIVTGAMRHPSSLGADGPANLYGAALVAVDSKARGQGVLVVANDEIHRARYVHKSHTMLTSTFVSSNWGKVGLIAEGRVHLHKPYERYLLSDLHWKQDCAQVALIQISLDEPLSYLADLPSYGYRGVVVAGVGSGHTTSRQAEALKALASQIPVVIASRTGEGPILEQTYGYPGSEKDLLPAGIISAGILPPLKARLLLMALLSSDLKSDDIAERFTSYAWQI